MFKNVSGAQKSRWVYQFPEFSKIAVFLGNFVSSEGGPAWKVEQYKYNT